MQLGKFYIFFQNVYQNITELSASSSNLPEQLIHNHNIVQTKSHIFDIFSTFSYFFLIKSQIFQNSFLLKNETKQLDLLKTLHSLTLELSLKLLTLKVFQYPFLSIIPPWMTNNSDYIH